MSPSKYHTLKHLIFNSKRTSIPNVHGLSPFMVQLVQELKEILKQCQVCLYSLTLEWQSMLRVLCLKQGSVSWAL